MSRICILIPAYNEEKVIASVLKQLTAFGMDVIVVDDGSTDSTASIAEKNGAKVLKESVNKGKGAALRRGFDYVLDSDYQAVITMDSDGQHSPQSIKDFIDMQSASSADIVVGNRMRNTENMPIVRIITNRFMSWIISHASRQKIPDTQCGFRLIKRDVLENIRLLSSRYDMESEILITAAKRGYKIVSVPIETIYKGQVSKIHPFLDTVRFIKIYIRLLFVK